MHDDLFADIQQTDRLLSRLRGDLRGLAEEVAADVGEPSEVLEPVVGHVLDGLAGPGRLSQAELARLQAEGAAAARAGRPVRQAIDRYLSTGWVIWDQALRSAERPDREVLAALGAALLRAGDDAAAALAAGHTEAETRLARQAGSARRAVIDELLGPAPTDAEAAIRRGQRATTLGLEPEAPYRLVVVRAADAVEDQDGRVEAVERILARAPSRQASLVTARQGDLVLILADPWRSPGSLDETGAALRKVGAWWAVDAGPVRIGELGATLTAARSGIEVCQRLDREGRIVPLADLALERAMLVDPALLRGGVATWLGPILGAPRGGEALVATLEAWLAAGQSVTATARALGLGARTVSYRLERIAALLGRPSLDPQTRLRLATALVGQRLLGPDRA